MLIIEKLNDGHPRVAIVHIIAKARGIDDSQTYLTGPIIRQRCKDLRLQVTFEEFLLEFRFSDLNLNSLVDLLCMTTSMIGVILDGGREQRIDEGSFSKPRLSGDLRTIIATSKTYMTIETYHDRECSSTFCDNFVPEVMSIPGLG